MKKIVILFSIIVSASLFPFCSTLAASCNGIETNILDCESNNAGSIRHLLIDIIDILVIGVGILAVVGIVVSGIQYLTAKGNPEQATKSKRRMYEIMLGLVAYIVIGGIAQWLLPGGVILGYIDTENVTVRASNLDITVGDSVAVNAVVWPLDADNQTLTYSSANPEIASIDKDGNVTGIGLGTTTITVKTYNDKIATSTVTVKELPKEEEETESSDSSSNVIDPKDLEIHFYATGKDDDAILIRTKDKTIVIDGGRCDNKEHSDSDSSCSRGMGFVNYLKEAGVTKIDVLIGSHVEWDHIQAQSVIVKNIPVTTAYYSVNIMNCTRNKYCSSEDYKYIKDALVSKGVNTTTISPPYTLTLGDMKFYFIGPNSLTSDNNKNSFVFILEYGKNKFMFTGDQSWWNLTNTSERGAALTKLENNARSLGTDIKVNLFKWPHHGYNQNGSGAHWNTSYGDAFFNAIKATYTIIPNGQSGCSGIPGSEARAFISKFNLKSYSTCGGNNIVVTSDGESIKIHEKQSPSSWKPTNQSTNTSSSSGGTRIGSSIADATFIDGNGCDDSTIFPGTKYNLDESQIKLVADRVGRENCGSPIACKAEASQIVNLYEYQHATNHSQARGSFWDWFKRTSWYATSYSGLNLSRVTQKGIDAVKDVIVNGNRTLPARVVGHDTLEFQYPGYQYNITGFYTEGGQWRSLTASTSSQLIPGKTELTRRGASNKTFWCIIKYGNNKYGDPFTY